MSVLTPFRYVAHAAGVFGAEKSFRANPVIGSPALNRRGLHRWRVASAAAMAARRRRALAARLSREDREALDAEGLRVIPDYLPPERWEALREAVFGGPLPAREMRQGRAVTRMAALSGPRMRPARALGSDPRLLGLMSYAAGRAGAPVLFVQSVIADPAERGDDPQTALHADTFHSTAKCWLFLTDVGLDEGPFTVVPGSHRLTPERLEWEYAQSLDAREAGGHHALGSFRVGEDALAGLGYGPPRALPVKANTLVVADTFAFHRRAPSAKPTTRVEIHGYLRRNPFAPWNGLDPAGLPGVRGRQLSLFFGWLDLRKRLFGGGSIWKPSGDIAIDAPPAI